MQRIMKCLEREFWNFLVNFFLPFFMVYLTEACSFANGYSFFTSQVSKLFMAIKKMIIFTNDVRNMASDV